MKFRPALAALGLGVIAAAATMSAGTQGEASQGNAAQADVAQGNAAQGNVEQGSGHQGNAERGEVLAYTCHGCHGVPDYKNAYPNYRVPKLGGQSAQYLINALNAYAAGHRTHPTMHAQAVTLTDQDRADIAAYLQSRMVPSGTEVIGTPPPATQTCVACHGPNGAKAAIADYPILAGQYADYIVRALQDYKSGKRQNPVMAGIVTGIDENDFEAIARFFEKQPGLCSTDKLREHGRCMYGEN